MTVVFTSAGRYVAVVTALPVQASTVCACGSTEHKTHRTRHRKGHRTGQITRLIAAYWGEDGLTGVVGINASDGLGGYRQRLHARNLEPFPV